MLCASPSKVSTLRANLHDGGDASRFGSPTSVTSFRACVACRALEPLMIWTPCPYTTSKDIHLRSFVPASAAVVVMPGASKPALMAIATVTADMTIVLPDSPRVKVSLPRVVDMRALTTISAHSIRTFYAMHANMLDMSLLRVTCLRRPYSSPNI